MGQLADEGSPKKGIIKMKYACVRACVDGPIK